MELYIGAKLIKAAPLTRGDYNTLRGWAIPTDENPNDEGFLVEYIDGGKPNHHQYIGYISWSPKAVFEKAYRATSGLTFGMAVEALKLGRKVARTGWNGKGMFLYYVPANSYPAGQNPLGTMKGIFENDMVPYLAYVAMKTADNKVVPWLASQTDILADDWELIDA